MPKGKKKDKIEDLFKNSGIQKPFDPEVASALDSQDIEDMKAMEVSDEEKQLSSPPEDTGMYFDVVEEGTDVSDGYAHNDMKDVIMPLWEKAKSIPRSQWVKIRLLKAVCDPTVAMKQHEELMEAAKGVKDTPRLAINLENWKNIQENYWKKGTILNLPKPIADFYLSINYVLGYEGFGHRDPSKADFPGMEHIGKPVIQRTAELVN